VKVFGIYTHAQLDKRLWDSISRQLTKKGSEYRRRCLFRNQPAVIGDKTYSPACFPPIEKPAEEEEIFAEIPVEKLEEASPNRIIIGAILMSSSDTLSSCVSLTVVRHSKEF